MYELATVDQNQLQDQAGTDAQVLALWLHGRSPHTQRAYSRNVHDFLDYVDKPLARVTLGDLQWFAGSLELAPASVGRALSAVKSLLAFASRLGYTRFDVGKAYKLPRGRDGLAARILSESEVQRMMALEPNPRNAMLLRLLYAAGVRVAEVCALTWHDLQERGDAGQLSVFGKGRKTRTVLLPATIYDELVNVRGDAGPDDPMFRSRNGGHLDESQVLRIVRAAARRAGITANVSPHWLRHSHATHALERGAPIHLVAATLGHASVATTGRYLHARPTDSSARYLPL